MRRFAVTGLVAAALLVGCRAPVEKPKDEGAASLKEETRMPWTRPGADFLRTWLVCGEFPNPPHEGARHYDHTPPCIGLDTDYLADRGGEAAIQPVAGMTHTRPDGSQAAWAEHTAPKDTVDFRAIFKGRPTDDVVAYACTTIERERAGEAVLAVGSDDGVRIWLNGKVVHDHLVARGVRPDQDIVPVELAKGTNRLLVKVEQGGGGWGFVLRVFSPEQAAALGAGEMRPAIGKAPEDQPDVLAIETDSGLGLVVENPQPVLVEAVAPGGRIVAEATATRGAEVRFSTKAWPDGPFEIRVSKRVPEGPRLFRHLPWYKGDWLAQVRPLLDACDALPEKSTRVLDARLRVLGDIMLDRLGGDPRKTEAKPKPDDWKKIHGPLMEYRELAMGARAAVRPHGFVRLAWIDETDGSAQLARAYLPPSYDPAERWPMAVILHGYNPSNPPYARWWGVTNRHHGIAERHGLVVLEPHGRGNASYRGIGDADVLRAIAEAKRAFAIDDDRVYLTGYSMGGGGTWHVGTAHPELFAAIGPVYGGWDYHVWLDEDGLATLTPRQRYQNERSSSFARAEALLNTPVFINHGDADSLVEVEHSRYAVAMLQRWGYRVRYWEHPGKGHGRLGHEGELVRWFITHKRDPMPRRVRVRAARLRYATAHWVSVQRRRDPFAFIEADARITDRHTIRLDTSNVLEVRLAPGEPLLDREQPVRVVWNGEDGGLHRFLGGSVLLRAPDYAPAKVAKTPGREGPLDDVRNTPFAIVVGTASKDPRMRRFCRLRAEQARDDWTTWQHVEPRFFLDTEITNLDVRRYSLLLFGGPDENLVARKLAKDVPLTLEPDAVTIGGERFPVTDAAVRMAYPHPLNPDRYVAVTAGNSAAGMFLTDRLPDDVDFVIADGRIRTDDDLPGETFLVASGCFDGAWRYCEDYVTRGDDALRAKAPRRKAPTHLSTKVHGKRLYLSDLLEAKSEGSFAIMMRDRNWQGKPIRLGRRTYRRGIGVQVSHEPCTATYDLAGGGWTRLRATLGIEIDDPAKLEPKQKDGTRVFFIVRGDGQELFRSPTFRWNSRPVELDVDITGVEQLQLGVGNEVQWHNAATSVNWADLRLER